MHAPLLRCYYKDRKDFLFFQKFFHSNLFSLIIGHFVLIFISLWCMQNFHHLTISHIDSDIRLNNPFIYRPHGLVVEASRWVVDYLLHLSEADVELREELQRGKMLGVLVVRSESGEVGFLSAFSGSIGGRTKLDGFVPPIYDLDCEGGYFRDEERAISDMKREIEALENSATRQHAIENYDRVVAITTEQLSRARAEYAEARARRRIRREQNPELKSQIDRESQHQKGELRRLELRIKSDVDEARSIVELLDREIASLKQARATRSQTLQRRMFDSYRVVNGRGEWRSLLSIFEERYNRLPPSGSGECAAPKLLHYALTHALTPLAVGEFWHGASPRGEVRCEGEFYGACKGKCEPILNFVLQGIELEPVAEALSRVRDLTSELTVLYEDDDMVAFDKPSGMLSVRGNIDAVSVESVVQDRYKEAFMVHRLDQDTSGVIVVAKSRVTHRELQRQFIEREVEKSYIALVAGRVEASNGEIRLPLSPDPLDRPRQRVDHAAGRSAHTSFEVVEYGEGYTRLHLTPHTGRTHQLRLHSAHREGLNAPIIGDTLYGKGIEEASRLMLHATKILLTHPSTSEELIIESQPNF